MATIEDQTPCCATMYSQVRLFSSGSRPWDVAVKYQTKPDERFDLTLVSQRVYGRRDEFLTVMAAAGLDSVEQELKEQLLVLPTEAILRTFKERAGFKNTAQQRRYGI